MKHRPARAKIIAVLLDTLMSFLNSLNHRWKSLKLWLQVADEQRRLAGCGYDGRVVRVEGQLYVVRG